MVRSVQPSSISSAAGVMPAAVMAETVRAASSTVSKIAQQRRRLLRLAQQLHRNRRGDADRAFRADEESGQIVAAGFGRFAAEVHDFAAGQHHFHPGHVIDGDAVHQRVRAAGIFRDIAADSAGFLAGRIGREIQPEMRDVFRELQIDHARLHHRAHVFRVDFEDAVHARENDDKSALGRDRAAAQSGARAARHHGKCAGRRPAA